MQRARDSGELVRICVIVFFDRCSWIIVIHELKNAGPVYIGENQLGGACLGQVFANMTEQIQSGKRCGHGQKLPVCAPFTDSVTQLPDGVKVSCMSCPLLDTQFVTMGVP